MKPAFITFTGIDGSTDLAGMIKLAEQYPIEFGVLFSPERQGKEPRYPDFGSIFRMLEAAIISRPTMYAAHLCGGYSRQLLAKAETEIDGYIAEYFDRAQINTAHTGIDTTAVNDWARDLNVTPILQCRESFSTDPEVQWLFDASGGRGLAPAAWPAAPKLMSGSIGYAGGLGPDTIATAIVEIECAAGANPYWIDMESGVRTDDRFDLAKCRAVCEAVYGVRP